MSAEGMPIVTDGQQYGCEDEINIENLYLAGFFDSQDRNNIYVYDPDNEPRQVVKRGAYNLKMSHAQAAVVRDRLIELLGPGSN